jgi:hypothetical protein
MANIKYVNVAGQKVPRKLAGRVRERYAALEQVMSSSDRSSSRPPIVVDVGSKKVQITLDQSLAASTALLTLRRGSVLPEAEAHRPNVQMLQQAQRAEAAAALAPISEPLAALFAEGKDGAVQSEQLEVLKERLVEWIPRAWSTETSAEAVAEATARSSLSLPEVLLLALQAQVSAAEEGAGITDGAAIANLVTVTALAWVTSMPTLATAPAQQRADGHRKKREHRRVADVSLSTAPWLIDELGDGLKAAVAAGASGDEVLRATDSLLALYHAFERYATAHGALDRFNARTTFDRLCLACADAGPEALEVLFSSFGVHTAYAALPRPLALSNTGLVRAWKAVAGDEARTKMVAEHTGLTTGEVPPHRVTVEAVRSLMAAPSVAAEFPEASERLLQAAADFRRPAARLSAAYLALGMGSSYADRAASLLSDHAGSHVPSALAKVILDCAVGADGSDRTQGVRAVWTEFTGDAERHCMDLLSHARRLEDVYPGIQRNLKDTLEQLAVADSFALPDSVATELAALSAE